MNQVKIKSKFSAIRIAFGSSGLPLGKRSDLDDIAILALETGDKELLNYFEKLPSLESLKLAKFEASK